MIAAFTLNVSIDRRYVVSDARHGAVNRVRECSCTAGGKGLNVTRVAHALGASVIAGGIAGGDSGRYITRLLDEEGVSHLFTPAAGESRSCINIFSESDGSTTEYLEPGITVSPGEYAAFLADFDHLAGKASVITLSGSLPKGLAPDTYAHLISRAREKGVPVYLDTSGASLASAIPACPAYIKPNEDEIAHLTGCDPADDAAVFSAAQALQRGGIGRVVVSMGARGAVMATSAGLFRAEAPRIDAVNAVGCGDAMTAAFAVAHERQYSDSDALHFAVAVSAASALSPFTGGLDPRDLDSLFPGVTVRKIG